jgi:hypothetical protein
MKLLKPMTIVYDSTMVTAGNRDMSSPKTIGIAVGVVLMGLVIHLTLLLLCLRCERKKQAPEQVEPKIENRPKSDESEEGPQEITDRIEAPGIAPFEADAMPWPPPELHSN